MRTPSVAVATLLVVVGLSACGNTSATKTAQPRGGQGRGVLAIRVGDTSIDAPRSVGAGLTEITVTSTGKARAHVILDRLAPGVTFDQIEKASSQEQDRLATVVGGNGAIRPGQSTTVILDLPAGSYEIVQISQSEGPPPTRRLDVTPPSKPAASTPPSKGEIIAKGRALTLPSGFDGKGTWKVTNSDTADDHEASIIQIAPGKSIADVIAYFKSHDRNGPPPAIAMGGMGDLPAGHSGWMMLDLPPGSYAVACFIPDDTGNPHLAMGMITPFEVG